MTTEDLQDISPSRQDNSHVNADSVINLSLLDPPRWGWSAAGGIVDVLAPHERARRTDAKKAYLEEREKRRQKRAERQKQRTKRIEKVSSQEAIPPHRNSKTAVQLESSKNLKKDHDSNPAGTNKIERAAVKTTEVEESKQKSARTDRIKDDQAQDQVVAETTHQPQHENQEANGILSTNAELTENSKQTKSIEGEMNLNKVGVVSLPRDAVNDSQREASGDAQQNQTADMKIDVESRTSEGKDSSNNNNNSNSSKERSIKPKAISGDGVLDMFTYHRGREGREPRDRNTGELLCDVKPTDTNHGWDKPNLTTSIKVTFPLADEDYNLREDDKGEEKKSQRFRDRSNPSSSKKSQQKKQVPYYTETIDWDLSDPKTPTAMSFAAGIAEDFGLSYCETLDLTASIQKQIDDFLSVNDPYVVPLSIKDPYDNDRDETALIHPHYAVPPELYGKYGATGKAGVPTDTSGGVKRKSLRSSTGKATGQPRGAVRKGPVNYEVVPFHLLPKHDGPLPMKNSRSGMKVSNGFKFSTEPEYRAEVLKRMKETSQADIRRKAQPREDGLVGVVAIEKAFVCHICHSRRNEVAVFGCGGASHAFCDFHCSTRLGFTIKNRDPEADPIIHDHCPICSLQCVCPKCCRRLDSIACELKHKSEQQGTRPEDTNFDFTLEFGINKRGAKKVEANRSKKRSFSGREREPDTGTQTSSLRHGTKRRKSDEAKKRKPVTTVVQKVPLSEFPREVAGGIDLDPASPDDYRTMYTASGNYIVTDNLPSNCSQEKTANTDESASKSPENVPSTEEGEEDGNVDYCHSCRKTGTLLCCDKCPRSFHRECVDSNNLPPSDNKKWECSVCVREKDGLPEDLIDGTKSLDLIKSAFADWESSDGYTKGIEVLSVIHQMLAVLINYEFGDIFSSPVDCVSIPTYKDIVKHPMDLGTIATNLVDGIYAKQLKDDKQWDDIVAAVLKDIELVWHNCFTFNYEGSAIFRMAEVHRMRHHKIQKSSFDHLLSDNVKQYVTEYVKECEQKRGNEPKPQSQGSTNRAASRPHARNKITVCYPHGGASRTVAVLDPDTGMVAKLYRSMKGASLAALCLSDLGHGCEIKVLENTVKDYIRRSSKEPTSLLFGYRWLYYDDLLKGKVAFPPETNGARKIASGKMETIEKSNATKSFSGFVEMIHDESTYLFISIEEAMSGLPDDVSTDAFRQTILGHPPGEKFSFLGRSWRRLLPKIKTDQTGIKEAKRGEMTTNISLCLSSDDLSCGAGFYRDQLEKSLPPYIEIVKEDLISRRKLLGFNNIKGAYLDWLNHRESSPGFPLDESKELEFFQCYYLDGNRNIDGLVWKTFRPNPEMEIETSGDSKFNNAGDDSQNRLDAVSGSSPTDDDNMQDFSKENDSNTDTLSATPSTSFNINFAGDRRAVN